MPPLKQKSKRKASELIKENTKPAVVQESESVVVEQTGSIVRVEFEPNIDDEILEDIDWSPSLVPELPGVPKFLFIASQYNKDLVERVGKVLLIESSTLQRAAEVCSSVLKALPSGCIHVEWCCPVHKAGP